LDKQYVLIIPQLANNSEFPTLLPSDRQFALYQLWLTSTRYLATFVLDPNDPTPTVCQIPLTCTSMLTQARRFASREQGITEIGLLSPLLSVDI
jgi:hypothetical protein